MTQFDQGVAMTSAAGDELLERLFADLEALTSLHGPSGFEGPVIEHLSTLVTPLCDELRVDALGNLFAIVAGGESPHIVVSAHADEIGFAVRAITDDGFLTLFGLGGVQPRLLAGRCVSVNGRRGVVGAPSAHLASDADKATVELDRLYVDLGVDSAKEVEKLGVRVGDPVVVVSELTRLAGARVAGKAIDNRAGCVVLLHLLRRLRESPPAGRLTAIFTVQEEVGFRGASAAFQKVEADLAIIIDTAPLADTPSGDRGSYQARLGGGLLVIPISGSGQIGFVMPQRIRDAIIAAAERCGVCTQLVALPRRASDASVAHIADGETATVQINIPRRYSHSPVETLDLRDLAATLAVSEELVRNPPVAIP